MYNISKTFTPATGDLQLPASALSAVHDILHDPRARVSLRDIIPVHFHPIVGHFAFPSPGAESGAQQLPVLRRHRWHGAEGEGHLRAGYPCQAVDQKRSTSKKHGNQ